MSKGTRWIKRAIALSLVLLLSIESFGAIVSDNDGSAFITKAEFDSLKNDFQSQIDSYNTSIDSKIDGAIAAYLAGINMAKKTLFYINTNEEQFMFMDPNQKNDYKTFQGSMGINFYCNIYNLRSKSQQPNSTAFVQYKATVDPVTFTYAVCRDKYNDLWLYKNLETECDLVVLSRGNYLANAPTTNLSNLNVGFWSRAIMNAHVDQYVYSSGVKLNTWSDDTSIYLCIAKTEGSGDNLYFNTGQYYAMIDNKDSLEVSAIRFTDYKDDKIRVLSTAKNDNNTSSDKKKCIPAIDLDELKYWHKYPPYAQPGNSRYASKGAVKFTLNLVANAYSTTSWESSSAIGTSATKWITTAIGKNYQNNDLRNHSFLPAIKEMKWDETTNVKNSSGEKLQFNDGHMFIKNASQNGKIECTVKFDEPLAKELVCFITSKRMNLKDRDTTQTKLPITYKNVVYKNNVNFPKGIEEATFTFEAKKGYDYYFFGCHSDGSGPIFKFENEAWITAED